MKNPFKKKKSKQQDKQSSKRKKGKAQQHVRQQQHQQQQKQDEAGPATAMEDATTIGPLHQNARKESAPLPSSLGYALHNPRERHPMPSSTMNGDANDPVVSPTHSRSLSLDHVHNMDYMDSTDDDDVDVDDDVYIDIDTHADTHADDKTTITETHARKQARAESSRYSSEDSTGSGKPSGSLETPTAPLTPDSYHSRYSQNHPATALSTTSTTSTPPSAASATPSAKFRRRGVFQTKKQRDLDTSGPFAWNNNGNNNANNSDIITSQPPNRNYSNASAATATSTSLSATASMKAQHYDYSAPLVAPEPPQPRESSRMSTLSAKQPPRTASTASNASRTAHPARSTHNSPNQPRTKQSSASKSALRRRRSLVLLRSATGGSSRTNQSGGSVTGSAATAAVRTVSFAKETGKKAAARLRQSLRRSGDGFFAHSSSASARSHDKDDDDASHHRKPTWTAISGITDIEILAQKSGINTAEERFKVMPDYAYPHVRMNRDELRAECRKTSTYFHTFRTVHERNPPVTTTSTLRQSLHVSDTDNRPNSNNSNFSIDSSYDNTTGQPLAVPQANQRPQDQPTERLLNSTALYKHDRSVIGTLSVEVMQCFGIPRPGLLEESTAFCVSVCGPHAFQTDVMPPVANPMWLSKMRRACIFPIYQAYEDLCVGVFSRQQGAKDGFAGRVVINICRLRPGSTYDVTLPLRMFAHIYSRQQRGAIRLRFHLDWYDEQKAVLSYLPNIRLPIHKPTSKKAKQLSNQNYIPHHASTWVGWIKDRAENVTSILPAVPFLDKVKGTSATSMADDTNLAQDEINQKYDYGDTMDDDPTSNASNANNDNASNQHKPITRKDRQPLGLSASLSPAAMPRKPYGRDRKRGTITSSTARSRSVLQPSPASAASSTSTPSNPALSETGTQQEPPPLPQPTIACCDAKGFQNVARVVHGVDMPGKFSMKRIKAISREITFTQIHILRYLRRRELHYLHTWKSPVISGFVFVAWMHCIWEGNLKHFPGHVVTLFLLYMWRNYGTYAIDSNVNGGFLSVTWEEMFLSLLWGGSTSGSRDDPSPTYLPSHSAPNMRTHSGRRQPSSVFDSIRSSVRGMGKFQFQSPAQTQAKAITNPRRMMQPIEMVRKNPDSMKTAMSHFQQAEESSPSSPPSSVSVPTNAEEPRKSIEEIASAFSEGITTCDYKTWFQSHRGCFVGSAGVTFLMDKGFCTTRADAVAIGQRLQKELKLFAPITTGIKDFEDSRAYYIFLTHKDDAYEIKTKQPLGRRVLDNIGFANPPETTIAEAHLEFPFATGNDHGRFTVKESLVIRSKESKQLLLMQAANDDEEAEFDDVYKLAMTKRQKLLRRVGNAAGVNGVSEADAAVAARLGLTGDAAAIAKLAYSKNGKPPSFLHSFSYHGSEGSDSDPDYLGEYGDDVDDDFDGSEYRYVVETKVLAKPPPQDINVVQKSDKKLPDTINEAKNMIHGMMFHIFNDKVYQMPKLTEATKAALRKRISFAPRSSSKVKKIKSPTSVLGAGSVISIKSRKNKKKLKRSKTTDPSTPLPRRRSTMNPLATPETDTKEEDQAYLAELRHDYDKLLGVNKYSNSNLILQKIAVIVQPMLEIMQAGLLVFRSLFNALTWRDPYLSFWITLIGPAIVVALHLFPWRFAAFVAGFVLIGPQNWGLRLYREKHGIDATPDFDLLTKKKKVKKDGSSGFEPNYFSSYAPDNRPVPLTEIDTSQPRTVVVPNSPLMYNRFYDWPPEPDYSRIYACSPPSSNQAAAQMLEANRFEDIDDATLGSMSRKKSKWKRVGKAMNVRRLLKKKGAGLEKIAE